MAEVTRKRRPVEFDLRFDPPLKEFNFRVEHFTSRISDWSGVMRAFSMLFQRHMAQAFETEGADTGPKWATVKREWAEYKARHNFGRKIGVYRGWLRSSMTGGGGYSEQITATSGSFGMSASSRAAPYGSFFAEKRPVVRLKAKHGREYQKVAHTWLVGEERGTMGFGGSGVAEAVRLGGVTGSVQTYEMMMRSS